MEERICHSRLAVQAVLNLVKEIAFGLFDHMRRTPSVGMLAVAVSSPLHRLRRAAICL
jgi:hypothetical protein